jgi:hypothetical protein
VGEKEEEKEGEGEGKGEGLESNHWRGVKKGER